MDFAYSEFTPVKPRKNRRNKNTRTAPLPEVLALLRAQLRQEEWFAASSEIIKSSWDEFSAHAPAVLCLGLGSPSASPIARIQLAFLTETCQQLNVAPDTVSVFDPVFSPDDTALLAALGMHTLSQAADAAEAHALSAPTLCFMPHCDIALYDALLRANWSAAGLTRLFIVGNALQEYVDNKPISVLQAGSPGVLRAARLFERRPLPTSRAWPTAFNNTAVQFRLQRRMRPTPASPTRAKMATAAPSGDDDANTKADDQVVDVDDENLFADSPWATEAAGPSTDTHTGGVAQVLVPVTAPVPVPAPVSLPENGLLENLPAPSSGPIEATPPSLSQTPSPSGKRAELKTDAKTTPNNTSVAPTGADDTTTNTP